MDLAAHIKVAIVHDWLYGGGAEKVVLELHKMFPDAPIYTSYCSDEWWRRLDNKVVTGYLQRWPFSKLRKSLPLFRQWWFKGLDLSEFDLVISSSGNGEAKFAQAKKPAVHICYCHTPVHFYWRHYDKYIENPGFRPKWLARLGLKIMVKPLRKRDFAAAQRVDYFIANSSHIQRDIKEYYDRDSVTIYPPVEVSSFKSQASSLKRSGFITVGRLVPHKHTDIIIDACSQLDLPLKVIGSGPELARLKRLAGSKVEFLGSVDDETKFRELASAEAFVFASFDDFGITPIEAMACGTPVIAYHAGGALDYIKPGVTGEFFEEQTAGSLAKALRNFNPKKYSAKTIQESVQAFSAERFRQSLDSLLRKLTKDA